MSRRVRTCRPPPQGFCRGKSLASRIAVRMPALASMYAVMDPAGPPPTTTTAKSVRLILDIMHPSKRHLYGTALACIIGTALETWTAPLRLGMMLHKNMVHHKSEELFRRALEKIRSEERRVGKECR